MASDVNKSFGKSAAGKLGIALLSAVLIFMSVVATAQNVSAQATQTKYAGPLEKAGMFGRYSTKNVGIYIVYGTGNGVTPDQAGEHVTKKFKEYAHSQSKHYNTEYHVAFTDKADGISVSYLVGVSSSVGPHDILEGVKPEVLKEVIEKRDTTAKILEAINSPSSQRN